MTAKFTLQQPEFCLPRAADILRGNVGAIEYKNFTFGMRFSRQANTFETTKVGGLPELVLS